MKLTDTRYCILKHSHLEIASKVINRGNHVLIGTDLVTPMQNEGVGSTTPFRVMELGSGDVAKKISIVEGSLRRGTCMDLELFEDGLGIKIRLVDADKILSHVGLELFFKDRVDELLLFGEDSKLISSGWTIVGVKDFFTSMGTSSCKCGTTPAIPLLVFFEDLVVGFVPLDSFAKVIKDGGTLGRAWDRRVWSRWHVGVVVNRGTIYVKGILINGGV